MVYANMIYYYHFLQSECLSLLLQTMSREPHATCVLPGDARGNTAAHLAAKQGNVGCLHVSILTF